jgi:hypothetical protein
VKRWALPAADQGPPRSPLVSLSRGSERAESRGGLAYGCALRLIGVRQGLVAEEELRLCRRDVLRARPAQG